MDTKRMRLRYAGRCACCGASMAEGQEAWWSPQSHEVTCPACAASPSWTSGESADTAPPTFPSAAPSVAGGSAQREYERRRQRDREGLAHQWGRLAGVVEFLRNEPQGTRAWAKGAQGERRIGRRLDTLEVNGVVLMHDRKAPGRRGNIDHLAVASSGVWVIDAKNLSGTVELKNRGGWLTPDRRLYVGGRDRTTLIAGLAWQVETVRKALGDLRDVPVSPVLCIAERMAASAQAVRSARRQCAVAATPGQAHR